jgi:hypothetical protein
LLANEGKTKKNDNVTIVRLQQSLAPHMQLFSNYASVFSRGLNPLNVRHFTFLWRALVQSLLMVTPAVGLDAATRTASSSSSVNRVVTFVGAVSNSDALFLALDSLNFRLLTHFWVLNWNKQAFGAPPGPLKPRHFGCLLLPFAQSTSDSAFSVPSNIGLLTHFWVLNRNTQAFGAPLYPLMPRHFGCFSLPPVQSTFDSALSVPSNFGLLTHSWVLNLNKQAFGAPLGPLKPRHFGCF